MYSKDYINEVNRLEENQIKTKIIMNVTDEKDETITIVKLNLNSIVGITKKNY